jgi:serine/threonine protein kinase/alpha-tubulin suppressor-like RCC1 family protein
MAATTQQHYAAGEKGRDDPGSSVGALPDVSDLQVSVAAEPEAAAAAVDVVVKAGRESVHAHLPTDDAASRAAYYLEFKPRFALGRGQFGVAYLLQHKDGHKAVDKRIHLDGLKEEDRSNTWKEIELLRRLTHEGVVAFYHSYETEDERGKDGSGGGKTLHILMEYCDGGALDEAIAERKSFGQPFEVPRVRHWVLQITSALAYIHSERVIHRDLKTANIFLTGRDGELAKLGDFGISRLMSSQTSLANTQVGTPYYLSPELIIGQDGYDGRADVWSLGIILYELLAFTRPFSGDNLGMLALQITRRPPKPLPSATPHDLQELAMRCLNKEAAVRPTSRDLLHAEPLRTWREAAQPQPPPAQPSPSPSASASPSQTPSALPSPHDGPAPSPSLGLTPRETPRVGGSGMPMPAADPLAATTEVPLPLKAPVPLATPSTASQSAATPSTASQSALDAAKGGGFGGRAMGESSILRSSLTDSQMDAAVGALDFAQSRAPDGLRRLYQWGLSAEKLHVGDVQDPTWSLVQDQREELSSHEIGGFAVGRNAAAVHTRGGDVYTWKAPGSEGGAGPMAFARSKNPQRLAAAKEVRATCVGLTDEDLIMIGDTGKAWRWRMSSDAPAPLRGIPEGLRLMGLSCGGEHCVAYTAEGQPFVWGSNEYGQLGLGDEDDRSTPEPIELAEGAAVRSASCCANVTILLMVDGHAWSCGETEHGVLGHAPPEPPPKGVGAADDDWFDNSVPECVSELQLVVVPRNAAGMLVQVSCAPQHAAALTSDGRVLTWGEAEGGRLGRKRRVSARGASPGSRAPSEQQADSDNHARPSVVKFAIPDQNIVSLSAGGAHTLAVTSGGQLWLWGQISTHLSYTVPRLVLGPKLGHAFFLRVLAGDWVTLATAVPPPQDFDDEGED